MKGVIVVIGAGSIGQAIARRVSSGKHVLLPDLRAENVKAAADVLGNAGFEVSTANGGHLDTRLDSCARRGSGQAGK